MKNILGIEYLKVLPKVIQRVCNHICHIWCFVWKGVAYSGWWPRPYSLETRITQQEIDAYAECS